MDKLEKIATAFGMGGLGLSITIGIAEFMYFSYYAAHNPNATMDSKYIGYALLEALIPAFVGIIPLAIHALKK